MTVAGLWVGGAVFNLAIRHSVGCRIVDLVGRSQALPAADSAYYLPLASSR